MRAIQVHQVEFDADLSATMHNVAGQLAPTSRKTYLHDARHFAHWMADHALSLQLLSRYDLVAYRAYLGETYAKTTASRMWAVAGRLLDEAVWRQVILYDPAEGIRGFKTGDDESPFTALQRAEARALLGAFVRSTAMGKRDYALIMLLLRTDICLSEAAALTLGDITMEQGYDVAIIRHGNGNRRGLAKLLVEVKQAIDTYLEAIGRTEARSDMLLVLFPHYKLCEKRLLYPIATKLPTGHQDDDLLLRLQDGNMLR
jgi:integrase/recombinase XerD